MAALQAELEALRAAQAAGAASAAMQNAECGTQNEVTDQSTSDGE